MAIDTLRKRSAALRFARGRTRQPEGFSDAFLRAAGLGCYRMLSGIRQVSYTVAGAVSQNRSIAGMSAMDGVISGISYQNNLVAGSSGMDGIDLGSSYQNGSQSGEVE